MFAYIIINNMNIADWYFFSVLGLFLTALIIIVGWLYNSRLRIGYRAVLCELLHGKIEDAVDQNGEKIRCKDSEGNFMYEQVTVVLPNGKSHIVDDKAKPIYVKSIKGGVFKEIGDKSFRLGTPTVDIKDVKGLTIDLEHPTKMKFGWTEYYFDKKGNHLTFDGIFQGVPPVAVRKYLNNRFITAVVEAATSNPAMSMMIILGFVALFGLGFGFGYLAYPQIHPPVSVIPSGVP